VRLRVELATHEVHEELSFERIEPGVLRVHGQRGQMDVPADQLPSLLAELFELAPDDTVDGPLTLSAEELDARVSEGRARMLVLGDDTTAEPHAIFLWLDEAGYAVVEGGHERALQIATVRALDVWIAFSAMADEVAGR
jgi:hypothetical protein